MGTTALPKPVRIAALIAPLLPLCWIIGLGVFDALGADPGKTIVHELGRWAMNGLLLTLCITPLNHYVRWQLIPLRRTLGLYAFAYAVVHLMAYAFYYLGFDPSLLAQELVKRPYIVVGTVSLLLLTPLGITSTRGCQRRLGPRWKQLHRVLYVIVPLVILHFAWQRKAGLVQPVIYATWWSGLMWWRAKSAVCNKNSIE